MYGTKQWMIHMLIVVIMVSCFVSGFGMFAVHASAAESSVGCNTTLPWKVTLQAEAGVLFGKAIIETPNNLTPKTTLVSNLDGGRNSSTVTLKVQSDIDSDVLMSVRYRSGDKRTLQYMVNDEGGSWEDLTSGSWSTMDMTSVRTIHLKTGVNNLQFFAPDGANAPGLDYVTLERFDNTKETSIDSRAVSVSFVQNATCISSLGARDRNDIISVEEIPPNPIEPDKDFLGWYFGPADNPTQYRVTFPFSLNSIPQKIYEELQQKLVFTARFGHNASSSSIEKDGYRLIFDDEFDGQSLDNTKWVDKYLSSWSASWRQTQGHPVSNGIVSLQINANTQPWAPEFDGQTVINGFTTGQRNGLHNWNGTNQVRNPSDTELTHINQYGYYEMRMRGQPGSSRHSAWWLLGFEDTSQESAEIDIFEVLGRNNHVVPPALHSWKDHDAFQEGLSAYTNLSKDFNNEFHTYGFDWQQGTGSSEKYPDHIDWYVDGVKYASKDVNIDYPMIQLISLYEKRAGGWTGAWEWMPYPNTMQVDYVRVYKKRPSKQSVVSPQNLKVVDVTTQDLHISNDAIVLKQYGTYTEKNLPGTKSYVRVHWNDGIETQEPVVWDAITDSDLNALRSGLTITKSGVVHIAAMDSPVQTVMTSMRIIPEKKQYSSQGIAGDISPMFDGLTNESGAKSSEFTLTADDVNARRSYIETQFNDLHEVDGIDLWTNYGAQQGITAFSIDYWDVTSQTWRTLRDSMGNIMNIDVHWNTREQQAEHIRIDLPVIKTDRVRLVINRYGYVWGHIAMRELAWHMR